MVVERWVAGSDKVPSNSVMSGFSEKSDHVRILLSLKTLKTRTVLL